MDLNNEKKTYFCQTSGNVHIIISLPLIIEDAVKVEQRVLIEKKTTTQKSHNTYENMFTKTKKLR